MSSKIRDDFLVESGFLSRVFRSVWFDNFCGVIVGANLALIVWETDARAQLSSIDRRQSLNGNSADLQQQEDDLNWQIQVITTVNLVFLVYYSIECFCRFSATRPFSRFFFSRWNILDVFVVLVDVSGLMVQWATSGSETNLSNVALLRNLRMCRLLRLSRFFTAFRELYSLVCGLTNCMKTLLWSAGLILLTLTVWSIVAVEYVSPLMPTIHDSGLWEGCTWCPEAFETVMGANLTFFQIISGDGWSALARPIIRKHFWVAALFVSMIFVVSFGLLNLIIAAIVDTAALARENDIDTLARIRHVERQEAWLTFERLCIELDSDLSSGISLAELKEGLKANPMLQAYFSVMGVEEDDLEEVFLILDEDENGVLSYAEFHTQLYKMKTMEVKTQLFYVTRYVQVIQKQVAKQEEMLSNFLSSACGPRGCSPKLNKGRLSPGASQEQPCSNWKQRPAVPPFGCWPPERNVEITAAPETASEMAAPTCLVADEAPKEASGVAAPPCLLKDESGLAAPSLLEDGASQKASGMASSTCLHEEETLEKEEAPKRTSRVAAPSPGLLEDEAAGAAAPTSGYVHEAAGPAMRPVDPKDSLDWPVKPPPPTKDVFDENQLLFAPRVHALACLRHPEDCADECAGRPPSFSPRSEWSSCFDELPLVALSGDDAACRQKLRSSASDPAFGRHNGHAGAGLVGLAAGSERCHKATGQHVHEEVAEKGHNNGGQDHPIAAKGHSPKRYRTWSASEFRSGVANGHAAAPDKRYATKCLNAQPSHTVGDMEDEASDEEVLAKEARS